MLQIQRIVSAKKCCKQRKLLQIQINNAEKKSHNRSGLSGFFWKTKGKVSDNINV